MMFLDNIRFLFKSDLQDLKNRVIECRTWSDSFRINSIKEIKKLKLEVSRLTNKIKKLKPKKM